MRQMLPPAADARLRLCWLRETSPGRLESTFNLPVSAQALRPTLLSLAPDVSVQLVTSLADHLLTLTRPGQNTELHLPYLDRFDWSHRGEILARTGFRLHGNVLLPSELAAPRPRNRYYARLLAAAAFRPCVDATISDLSIAMPAGLFAAWRMAPAERHISYFRAHLPATRALQHALRDALPGRWLADPARWERVLDTCAVFAYATTSLHAAGFKTEFSHDVLDDGWAPSAFRGARKPLEQLLGAFHRHLIRTRQFELAHRYSARSAQTLINDFCGRRRQVRNLIALEGLITELFLTFGAKIRTAADPLSLMHDAISFVENLEVRLGRFHAGDLSELVPTLIIETTTALATSQIDTRLAA